MTKVDESHTRFVDEFNQAVNDETKLIGKGIKERDGLMLQRKMNQY